jgi:hypothetical protein
MRAERKRRVAAREPLCRRRARSEAKSSKNRERHVLEENSLVQHVDTMHPRDPSTSSSVARLLQIPLGMTAFRGFGGRPAEERLQ